MKPKYCNRLICQLTWDLDIDEARLANFIGVSTSSLVSWKHLPKSKVPERFKRLVRLNNVLSILKEVAPNHDQLSSKDILDNVRLPIDPEAIEEDERSISLIGAVICGTPLSKKLIHEVLLKHVKDLI